MSTEQRPIEFHKVMQFILRPDIEGGYSNHPKDPGGATNYGITQRTYDYWREKHGLEKQPVSNCTKLEALDIYWEEYWKQEWENLEFGIAAVLMDTAVNMGPTAAARLYKQGNGTVKEILEARRKLYRKIVEVRPTSSVFMRGWMARVDKLQEFVDANKNIG
jgi:lysozyme family protein